MLLFSGFYNEVTITAKTCYSLIPYVNCDAAKMPLPSLDCDASCAISLDNSLMKKNKFLHDNSVVQSRYCMTFIIYNVIFTQVKLSKDEHLRCLPFSHCCVVCCKQSFSILNVQIRGCLSGSGNRVSCPCSWKHSYQFDDILLYVCSILKRNME